MRGVTTGHTAPRGTTTLVEAAITKGANISGILTGRYSGVSGSGICSGGSRMGRHSASGCRSGKGSNRNEDNSELGEHCELRVVLSRGQLKMS